MHNWHLACRQLTQCLSCQLDIPKQTQLRDLHESRFTDHLAFLADFEDFALQTNAVAMPLDVYSDVVITRWHQAAWLGTLASDADGWGASKVLCTIGYWLYVTNTQQVDFIREADTHQRTARTFRRIHQRWRYVFCFCCASCSPQYLPRTRHQDIRKLYGHACL